MCGWRDGRSGIKMMRQQEKHFTFMVQVETMVRAAEEEDEEEKERKTTKKHRAVGRVGDGWKDAARQCGGGQKGKCGRKERLHCVFTSISCESLCSWRFTESADTAPCWWTRLITNSAAARGRCWPSFCWSPERSGTTGEGPFL